MEPSRITLCSIILDNDDTVVWDSTEMYVLYTAYTDLTALDFK